MSVHLVVEAPPYLQLYNSHLMYQVIDLHHALHFFAAVLPRSSSCFWLWGNQVREGVGNLMCVVAGNLSLIPRLQGTNCADLKIDENGDSMEGSVRRWSREMVEGATAAAAKIQARAGPTLGGTALAALGGVGPSSSSKDDDETTEGEAASKWMETVSFFSILKFQVLVDAPNYFNNVSVF